MNEAQGAADREVKQVWQKRYSQQAAELSGATAVLSMQQPDLRQHLQVEAKGCARHHKKDFEPTARPKASH